MKKIVVIGLLLLTTFFIHANSLGESRFTAVNSISFRLTKPKSANKNLYHYYNMNDILDIDKYQLMFDDSRNYMRITNFAATGEKSTAQEENIFRRMEILFFGSLTIITFSGWLAFSLFNIIIYSDDFGILRPSQNLALYLGSGILSLSVSVTDLINNLQKKRKFRYVEFY